MTACKKFESVSRRLLLLSADSALQGSKFYVRLNKKEIRSHAQGN
ncbi:hypothetical protein LEP1GSC123_0289 [Leptospira borgpetersenii str. 200701203]|uniref:Uncharacterized protein n=1 Tax=Leptospira borgpetersenii str. 200701203 TaxID=1193007 RepID=M3H4F0_LEPBO|nr:hypothetical protein LEP1GSC123_0289 [Leptospira borgpetersenii str. 200701203]